MEEVAAVVVDNGSGMCKAGIAGEEFPQVEIPAVLGERTVGEEAVLQRKEGGLRKPVERGVVQDWEGAELLWRYAVETELGMSADQHPLFVTEALLSPPGHREKMTEIMIETLNVPACYVCEDPLLSLFASGRGSGLVLSCGEGLTTCVPASEGATIEAAAARYEFAGSDLNSYLQVLLRHNGTLVDIEEARTTKERVCFLAEDFSAELTNSEFNSELPVSVPLPDGQVLSLRHERFLCPEALFQPSLAGKETLSLAELTASAVEACPDLSLQQHMCFNVIVAGGSTLFPGLPGKLTKELRGLLPYRVNVIAPPERKHSVWIGGSIVTSLSTFQAMWVTRRDYQEFGCSAPRKLF